MGGAAWPLIFYANFLLNGEYAVQMRGFGGILMMIMITKPRGKLKKAAAAGALVLLLGVAVPLGYSALSDVGAMSMFAAGDKISAEQTQVPSEEQALTENATENTESSQGLWQGVQQAIFGEQPQIIRY